MCSTCNVKDTMKYLPGLTGFPNEFIHHERGKGFYKVLQSGEYLNAFNKTGLHPQDKLSMFSIDSTQFSKDFIFRLPKQFACGCLILNFC